MGVMVSYMDNDSLLGVIYYQSHSAMFLVLTLRIAMKREVVSVFQDYQA